MKGKIMYLNQIRLNRNDVWKLKGSDSYAIHQFLWRSFHEDSKRSFQFRLLDVKPSKDVMSVILVLSDFKPELQDIGQWNSKEVKEDFFDHKTFVLNLKASPSYRSRESKKRTAIVEEEKLAKWFEEKSEKSGFSIRKVKVGQQQLEKFYKKGVYGHNNSVCFNAVIDVVDKEKFVAAYKSGIGHAKAFGFGMLMLQKVNA